MKGEPSEKVPLHDPIGDRLVAQTNYIKRNGDPVRVFKQAVCADFVGTDFPDMGDPGLWHTPRYSGDGTCLNYGSGNDIVAKDRDQRTGSDAIRRPLYIPARMLEILHHAVGREYRNRNHYLINNQSEYYDCVRCLVGWGLMDPVHGLPNGHQLSSYRVTPYGYEILDRAEAMGALKASAPKLQECISEYFYRKAYEIGKNAHVVSVPVIEMSHPDLLVAIGLMKLDFDKRIAEAAHTAQMKGELRGACAGFEVGSRHAL